MASDYTSQHKSRIANNLSIHPTYFEKGMIGEISYMKTVNKKKVLATYIILVLQPNWQGKLHALKLELISPSTLDSIAKPQGVTYSKRLAAFRKLNLPKIIMDESSQQFYNSNIKSILSTALNGSYRTFKIADITSAKVLDYAFPKSVDIITNEE
jgi:hypothetical protein